jgi:hypothetical protein
MNIMEIYEALRTRGLARSLRQFSSHYLGKAANYAADRGLSRCSADALLNLQQRLGDTGQIDLQVAVRAWLLDGHHSSRFGGRP